MYKQKTYLQLKMDNMLLRMGESVNKMNDNARPTLSWLCIDINLQ